MLQITISMKKSLLFLSLIFFLRLSYAQTIEIKEMDLQQPNAGPYLTITTEETDLDNTYLLKTVFFDYDEIDDELYHDILFTLYIDNGSSKQTINIISYAIAQGAKDISINGYSNINPLSYSLSPGTYEITIEATGLDSNSMFQTIAESDPWTINYSFNKILNNTICCNQTTLKYPFDPATINQAANTTVSTEDGASITSVQWQKLVGTIWTNIAGATQYSYDPPSVTADTKFRRVLTSSSGTVNASQPVSITKITEKIICCSQTTGVMPYDPNNITQKINTTVASNAGPTTTFTYQWQDSTNGAWNNISGATNSSYDPSWIKNPTGYRRIAISSTGFQNISNTVTYTLEPCDRPADQQNVICGDMTFYRVQHGDILRPGIIYGGFVTPSNIRREFGYD
jgi:hypothetical protein